jgi:hypothetical protein
MKKRKTKQHTEQKATHRVTTAECAAIQKYFARNAGRPSIRFKVSNNEGRSEIGFDHPNTEVGQMLLMDALGSTDWDFAGGIMEQLASASGPGGDIDESRLNFMLSVIKGIEPRDQIGAMLGAQMGAVHVASMVVAARLIHSENIPEQDSMERAFNKLTRTFATQVEALKRYRSGADQKVTLQHVSVADGGQAIVGNVTQTPRENREEKAGAASPAPAVTDTNVVPMPTPDKSKEQDAVPLRRKLRK